VQSWTVPGETLVGKVEVEVEEVEVEEVEVVEVIKVEVVEEEEVVIKVVEEVVEVKRPRHQQTKRKSIFPV
jgi:hypothetical protein